MPPRRPTLRSPITAVIVALAFAGPALAQSSTVPGLSDPLPPSPGYTDPNQPPLPSTMPGAGATPDSAATPGGTAVQKNITATGRTMPPTTGRAPASPSSVNDAEMQKAQKATEARNKAWDAKMRKTMGSICVGC